MSNGRFGYALLAALALVCSGAARADGDGFVGHWALNLSESKTFKTAAPRAMTIDMQAQNDAILYKSQTTATDGRLQTAEYSARYDGVPALVRGDAGLLMPVKLRRLDPLTVEASYLRGFTVVAVARRQLSVDGKRMTISTTLNGPDGREAVSTLVFDKIEETKPF